jgi:hypothetical protein
MRKDFGDYLSAGDGENAAKKLAQMTVALETQIVFDENLQRELDDVYAEYDAVMDDDREKVNGWLRVLRKETPADDYHEGVGKRGHLLLTKELEKQLPPLYTNEQKGKDAQALVKFFSPLSNWTWYASEYDPESRTFFGLVDGFEKEFGYFSLDELEGVEGPAGMPAVERDMGWGPKTFREILGETAGEAAIDPDTGTPVGSLDPEAMSGVEIDPDTGTPMGSLDPEAMGGGDFHEAKPKPILTPFGGRDEQAETERFEGIVGGPERGFRLMRIHERATQAVSGDRFRMSGEKRSAEEVFRRMAKNDGFSDEAIDAFLALP